MGRPAKYDSDEERKAADAERKRQARGGTPAGPPARVEQRVKGGQPVSVDQGYGTVTRYDLDGHPVEEPVGPAGLSLIAFPTQTPGSLTPSAAALAKLGQTVGQR